jgi:hypothetical protein
MKKITFFLALFTSFTLIAQNNALILQDAVHVNIDAGAILIVAQTSPSGIVTQGTNTGVINSEGETNRVAWIINSGTGNYTIPFGINSAARFPMTYSVTAAGSASGALTASTFPTNINNIPYPSVYAPAVTNTGAQWIGGAFEDRSLYCNDRFWVLRDLGMAWATKPTSSLTFTYRDVENAPGNTITEANLQAQYWETNQWQPGWFTGLPLLGASNTVLNTVSGVNATTLGNLYTWILVDNTNPLPIELLYFAVTCHEQGTMIEWASASETNNDYYTIQKSFDGGNWETLAYITGAGNSNQPLYYSFMDYEGKNQNAVYRLIQTDYDGSQNLLGVKDANCNPYTNGNISEVDMNLYADDENNIYVSYFSPFEEMNVLTLYDMNGKIIGSWNLNSVEGINHFQIPVQPVSHAIYLVSLQQNHSATTKKILLK